MFGLERNSLAHRSVLCPSFSVHQHTPKLLFSFLLGFDSISPLTCLAQLLSYNLLPTSPGRYFLWWWTVCGHPRVPMALGEPEQVPVLLSTPSSACRQPHDCSILLSAFLPAQCWAVLLLH